MRSPPQAVNDPVAKLLALADLYANGLTLCDSPASEVAPMRKSDCHMATGQEDPAVPDGAIFRGEIVSLTAVLGRLSAVEERELGRPLIRPTNARVWLMRDRTFSAFDPIEALLSTLARVTVADRLPQGAEVPEIDRVIVLTPTTMGQANVQELQHHFAASAVLWLAGEINTPVPPSAAVQPILYPARVKLFRDFLSGPAAVAAA